MVEDVLGIVRLGDGATVAKHHNVRVDGLGGIAHGLNTAGAVFQRQGGFGPDGAFGGQAHVRHQYVGPGYSLPTDSMIEAVKLFAGKEAILLDPVYSGKAAAGLIDLVRKGHFPKGSNVLFLHTGGSPALYAYLDTFRG